MRYKTVEAPYRRDPGPEEIVLDGWLEESGPYMSLREEGLRRQESGLRAGPVARPDAAEA